jgi:hypothetical protein
MTLDLARGVRRLTQTVSNAQEDLSVARVLNFKITTFKSALECCNFEKIGPSIVDIRLWLPKPCVFVLQQDTRGVAIVICPSRN